MKLCRLCIENTGTIDIFEDTEGISISSKIMHCCANIRVHREDGKPDQVCKICEMELSRSYQFVLKCEAADKKLQSLRYGFSEFNEDVILRQGVIFDQDVFFEEEVYLEDVHLEEHVKLEEDVNFDEEVKVEKDGISEDIKLDMKVDEDSPTEFDIGFTNQAFSNGKIKIKQCKDLKSKAEVENSNPLPKEKVKISKTISHSNENVTVGGKYKCKLCGRQCKRESTLIIHMRSHTNERPYSCQSCNKTYKDGRSLKRHTMVIHNKNRKREVICEICGKAFYSKPEVKSHMRTHTGETPYACDICPSKFKQIGSLMRHKLRHTDNKRHSCPICKKKFHLKVDLKKHEMSHSSEKNFKCFICNIDFKYLYNLKTHISQHTSTTNFICDYCGRIFKTKGCVQLHINRIHSSKSGNCNICSKHVPNIEVHMWKHTGHKPLKCDMCASSFNNKKSLSQHISYWHKCTKTFKCTEDGCSSTFPRQKMLDYHVAKFHRVTIPFPCDFCPKGFYRRNDINRHMRFYHKEVLATG